MRSCLSLLKNYDHIILIAASLDHTCCILCCSYYSITCSQARGCDRLVFWPVQQLYLLICYFLAWMLIVCEISPYDRETSCRALQGWISQGHKFCLMDSCWTCSCCLWYPWRYWTYFSSFCIFFYFALQSYIDCTVQPFGNACGFCNSISVPDINWKLQFWQITQMVALVNLSW